MTKIKIIKMAVISNLLSIINILSGKISVRFLVKLNNLIQSDPNIYMEC